MTKKEMIQQIAEKVGVPRIHVQEVIQGVFDGITDNLVQKGRIELRNFGVFEVRERKPRIGRNPRTGEKVEVPAKLVVRFQAGLELEERVRQLPKLPNGG